MSNKAKLIIEGNEHELDIIEGSEGEKALDIRKLRADTGYITMDSGYANTGAAESSVTYLDGEQGVLRYRGYPIEQLAENSSFTEVAYLVIYGKLPNKTELSEFRELLTYHSMIHEGMRHFFEGFPPSGHPMSILSSMVCSLSAYYPDCLEIDADDNMHVARVLSKVRTIAAFAYKHFIGQPIMYPRNDLNYCANFLYMMFAVPAEPYEPSPEAVKALNMLLILHADHEQNCSTSTVRLVGSSNANLYASISAGILALWGPLHGGANQAVIEMLEQIRDKGGDYKGFMQRVKDKEERLMGFGHRVYKNFDPRAKLLRTMADELLTHLGIQDPLLNIAKELEQIALADEYFIERKLYPNVDFYSGIVYRALGIPTNMFTVMFALGRLPGWIAHWREMHNDPGRRIGRPRQVYVGEQKRDYVPMDQRK
ncbi:citrate synthase [Haliangium ochraceum]|uniref:Citrate synthase n=1 Tax=Haliangium ochraceum (strain DSM 14365 / JCM 11303 / SMP-2) TaxID=502025 RepID=D0LX44_HALO1|nr:citrate synthase [Haliangium ochraceum]ACY16086.1 citrate synthase I [Haliangium ochraceum DSM 14365]